MSEGYLTVLQCDEHCGVRLSFSSGRNDRRPRRLAAQPVVGATILWLSCPVLVKACGALEQSGVIGKVETQVLEKCGAQDDLLLSYRWYNHVVRSLMTQAEFAEWSALQLVPPPAPPSSDALRARPTLPAAAHADRYVSEGVLQTKYGNAGVTSALAAKCLHAHTATFMAGLPTPYGAAAASALLVDALSGVSHRVGKAVERVQSAEMPSATPYLFRSERAGTLASPSPVGGEGPQPATGTSPGARKRAREEKGEGGDADAAGGADGYSWRVGCLDPLWCKYACDCSSAKLMPLPVLAGLKTLAAACDADATATSVAAAMNGAVEGACGAERLLLRAESWWDSRSGSDASQTVACNTAAATSNAPPAGTVSAASTAGVVSMSSAGSNGLSSRAGLSVSPSRRCRSGLDADGCAAVVLAAAAGVCSGVSPAVGLAATAATLRTIAVAVSDADREFTTSAPSTATGAVSAVVAHSANAAMKLCAAPSTDAAMGREHGDGKGAPSSSHTPHSAGGPGTRKDACVECVCVSQPGSWCGVCDRACATALGKASDVLLGDNSKGYTVKPSGILSSMSSSSGRISPRGGEVKPAGPVQEASECSARLVRSANAAAIAVEALAAAAAQAGVGPLHCEAFVEGGRVRRGGRAHLQKGGKGSPAAASSVLSPTRDSPKSTSADPATAAVASTPNDAVVSADHAVDTEKRTGAGRQRFRGPTAVTPTHHDTKSDPAITPADLRAIAEQAMAVAAQVGTVFGDVTSLLNERARVAQFASRPLFAFPTTPEESSRSPPVGAASSAVCSSTVMATPAVSVPANATPQPFSKVLVSPGGQHFSVNEKVLSSKGVKSLACASDANGKSNGGAVVGALGASPAGGAFAASGTDGLTETPGDGDGISAADLAPVPALGEALSDGTAGAWWSAASAAAVAAASGAPEDASAARSTLAAKPSGSTAGGQEVSPGSVARAIGESPAQAPLLSQAVLTSNKDLSGVDASPSVFPVVSPSHTAKTPFTPPPFTQRIATLTALLGGAAAVAGVFAAHVVGEVTAASQERDLCTPASQPPARSTSTAALSSPADTSPATAIVSDGSHSDVRSPPVVTDGAPQPPAVSTGCALRKFVASSAQARSSSPASSPSDSAHLDSISFAQSGLLRLSFSTPPSSSPSASAKSTTTPPSASTTRPISIPSFGLLLPPTATAVAELFPTASVMDWGWRSSLVPVSTSASQSREARSASPPGPAGAAVCGSLLRGVAFVFSPSVSPQRCAHGCGCCASSGCTFSTDDSPPVEIGRRVRAVCDGADGDGLACGVTLALGASAPPTLASTYVKSVGKDGDSAPNAAVPAPAEQLMAVQRLQLRLEELLTNPVLLRAAVNFCGASLSASRRARKRARGGS